MLFAREAKKIIVDIDPAELGKFSFKVDMPLCADSGNYIKALIDAKPKNKQCTAWQKQCAMWNEKYDVVLPEHRTKENFVSIYALVEVLSDFMNKDDIIVPGSSGMGSDIPYQVLRLKDGQRMFNSPGIGSMGFGIPSALGACIASGGKRIICTNGDGGFQMNIQELETIKALNLPVIFFVLNNGGYASIRNTQRNYFDGFYVGSDTESGVSLPDVYAVGEAYRYNVFSINENREIKEILNKVFNCNGPVICEVIVDPFDTLSFRSSSFLLPDGTALAVPPEDLYPFLSRKEFYGNMIVKPTNKTGINIINILLDLDGTLVDSSAGIISSMIYAFKICNCMGIEENTIKKTIGLPLMSMIKKLLPEVDEQKSNEIAKCYRSHYAETGLYDGILYDGILELLEIISKEYDLYIVTSKPYQFAENLTKKLDIHKYFQSIKGPELNFTPKSKSELIAELLNEEKLRPENCVMVGDREEDILAAAANQIRTVGVSYGFGTIEELKKAVLIVSNTHELMKALF
jgi:phosphoglycolate phosphatase-like HAD superfamily hydrolase